MITIKKPSGNIQLKSPLPTKMIVSGEAMAGKTTFVGKFPTPFFLSFDGNAIKEGRDGVDLRGAFDYQDVINAIPEIVKAGYKTIVVDTIEDMLDGIERGVANGGSITDMTNSFNGWAKLNGRFKKLVTAIDDSKLITVFIARTTIDADGNIKSDAREKNYSWLKGRIDGEIFINKDHTAEWRAHRGYWKQDELPDHLKDVADPEREGQERKEAALKRRQELMNKAAEKKN
ncbi:AAA family ATPase [Fructobacillus sp. CRL 2054]|uniref:AAA family ATPase n=1 Tax=Fructobacillus sp. CRL 2054 TaxID=2763007 RepID=UPI002378B14A|nr:AAA family ATPase [Fructobacillus sp. CRL 2054]MDD9138337.1 AAA family ATPase [Fructobacillus sp. CRL 2054]